MADRDHADLPWVLVDPPWLRRGRRPKATVVRDLAGPTGEDVLTWGSGEREVADAEAQRTFAGPYGPQAAAKAAVVRRAFAEAGPSPRGVSDYPGYLALLSGSTAEAAPMLAAWRPESGYYVNQLLATLAVHGDAAVPLAVDVVRRQPRDLVAVLELIEGPGSLAVALGWLGVHSRRADGVAWLKRHAAYAAAAIVPVAVGPAGAARRRAGVTLRLLVAEGQADAVQAAAQVHGPAAVAAVDEVLAEDPRLEVPARLPELPDWVDAAALPALRRADDGTALPIEAVAHVLTMLRFAPPLVGYAGLDDVCLVADRRDLASYAWALFEQWEAVGSPIAEKWVLAAQGWLGDDETVVDLLAHIHEHRSDPRAVHLLDALVAIGSDAALVALQEIGEKVKTPRVRKGARERIVAVAERLGLSADQLADRLVPDLGLDARGSTVLDFGPRRFTIGFDEQLRPTVADEDGTRRKALPKAGARDDVERAEAAWKRFRALKRDAKKLGTELTRRLERAMVEGRRFEVDELRSVLVDRPLPGVVARRLVWATFAADRPAEATGAFRVAEDGTFADVDDRTLVVPDGTVVGVAHPLHLGPTVGAWSDLLADYELLQPFEQLGRSTHPVGPEQAATGHALDLVGASVDAFRLIGLARRGWQEPPTGDGGRTDHFVRDLPGGRRFEVLVNPGVAAWGPAEDPVQQVEVARLRAGVGGSLLAGDEDGPTFGELDPVLASEILRDAAWLLPS